MKKRVLALALAVLMVVACVPAIALPSVAATGYKNIAKGASVTAGNGHNASGLTDGSLSGYFDLGWWGATGGDPANAYPLAETDCWVEVDLGESYDIVKLGIHNLHQNYYWFEVYVGNDNTAAITDTTKWTKAAEYTGTAGSTWDHEFVLDAAINCRYVRVYGTFHSGNVGYHLTEVEAFVEAEPENILNIAPWAVSGGMENWVSGTMGDGVPVTQILMEITDSVMTDDSVVNGMSLRAGIEAGTYTTQLVINGGGYENFVMDIAPATFYNNSFRFEPCVDDTPFIPLKGRTYTITLNVLDAEGNVYAYGSNSWKCNMDPIYIYDGETVEPATKAIGWYGQGFDFYAGKLLLYPNHIATKYADIADHVVEMEVNNAIYTVKVGDNPYRWNDNIALIRQPIIEEGFTPVVDTTYSIVYKGYVYSTTSGTKTLQDIYTMPDVTFTETINDNGTIKELAAQVPFVYDITATHGKVRVGYDNETKTYTLTACEPETDYAFAYWTVDGAKVSTEPEYTFTAEDGANKKIVAVFTSEKVEITWVVNGQTMTTLVGLGGTIVCPVDAEAGYSDKYYTYTFTGWDKAIASTATVNTTYTASYTKELRPAREITVGQYANGLENWAGETQLLFTLKSNGNADLTEVWNNRTSYRFVFTYTWTEDGVTKTATSVCAPWSDIFGTTKDELWGRFEISASPSNPFIPKGGIEYIVNIDVYDMAAPIQGGYHYLTSNNTDVVFWFSDPTTEAITYDDYHTITWTKNGEVVATELWREGYTPVAPVSFYYEEGNFAYTLITAVVEVTGDATYELEYMKTSLTGSTPGDVNADGEVSIGDVGLLLDVLAGKGTCDGDADVTGDGEITVADVGALLDMLAGK